MTQPAGWYEDLQVPSLLRYWDGVVWSSHVTPKVSPTLEQSNIGMPYVVTPAAARPQAPGSHGAQGTPLSRGGFGPPPRQDQRQGQDGQWPAYGHDPGQFGQQRPDRRSRTQTTPDGVRLAGWWKRVLARIIDIIIVSVVALPLTFVPMNRASTVLWDYFQESFAVGLAGGSITPVLSDQLTADVNGAILQASLIMLAANLVYEVVFLTRTGATIGKRVVGISVRLRDQAGPPPMKAALGRSACFFGFQLFSVVSLLDVLWPLFDDKKQAIHDLVGATNVVVGSQPGRDA